MSTYTQELHFSFILDMTRKACQHLSLDTSVNFSFNKNTKQLECTIIPMNGDTLSFSIHRDPTTRQLFTDNREASDIEVLQFLKDKIDEFPVKSIRPNSSFLVAVHKTRETLNELFRNTCIYEQFNVKFTVNGIKKQYYYQLL